MRQKDNLQSGNSLMSEWLTAPEDLSLNSDEVHLWRASLNMTDAHVKALQNLLSDDELKRADRMHFIKNRDHFIICRGLLRTLLGGYLKREPFELSFYYGRYGKPELDYKSDGKALRFNVSYSHEVALLAFTYGQRMGVDIEYVRPDLLVEDMAEHSFSPREIAILKTYPEYMRQSVFFKCWTLKEAYLKALGTGLARDLKQCEVLTDKGDIFKPHKRFMEPREGISVSLMDLDVGSGYAAALVVEGHDWQLKCWQWANLP